MNVRIRKWQRWAAALLLMTGVGILSQGARPSLADTCIAPGADDTTAITAALSGPGAAAVLCAGATYNLSGPVTFSAPDQQIYTEGLPMDSTRATLVVGNKSTTDKTASIAIEGTSQSGITIENIQINGNRPALGQVVPATGGLGEALIEIGGNATGQTVQHVNAYETRGWSTLHIFQGTVTSDVPSCQGAQILNNTIWDAGTPPPTTMSPQTWADGISLACGTSLVENNTVTDATDGAIVIFGAPGSTISGNTITAVSRSAFGGIAMGDFKQVDGNYAGTTVSGNVINGAGAYIEMGIAMGTQVWGCDYVGTNDTNNGGTVTGNTVEGQNVGYGYPVNGVSNWTVTGNTDTARHVGLIQSGASCTTAALSPPGAFQVGSATSSTLQSPQYVTGQTLAHHVLLVTEPSILRQPQPPTSCGTLTANQGLYPRQAQTSCDGRFTLNMQPDGNLVLRQGAAALWASATSGQKSAEVLMRADGNVAIYDVTGSLVWSTGTSGHSGARLVVQNDGNLVVYSSANAALWQTGTCCH